MTPNNIYDIRVLNIPHIGDGDEVEAEVAVEVWISGSGHACAEADCECSNLLFIHLFLTHFIRLH